MAFGKKRTHHKPFDSFLEKTYRGRKIGNKKSIAHSFGIDENVVASRQNAYRRMGAMDNHASFKAWQKRHLAYLEKFVFLDPPKNIPKRINRRNPCQCPQTFRVDRALRPFGSAAPELHLVRMDDIDEIARLAKHSPEEIFEAAEAYLRDSHSSRKREYFASILRDWNCGRDLRPLWTGFWQDLRNLFGAPRRSDWANELRDRLGLYHLDPEQRLKPEIQVLVFKYPIELVPPLADRPDRRGLAIPTVLDNRFSEAFCPPPQDHPEGYSLYLGDRQPYRSYRELVHFYTFFEPKHLFKIGTINKAAPRDILQRREQHLQHLRKQTGRRDYGII